MSTSSRLTAIIMAVQYELQRRRLYTGEIDGDAGEKTWGAIHKAVGAPRADSPVETPGERTGETPVLRGIGDELAAIAESQVGTQEDDRHTNRGSAILKYQHATWWPDQGWPWCAAFVCWCVQQLFAKHPELAVKMERPQTPGAFDLINWAVKNGARAFLPSVDEPQRGDIVVYTFSHCGIVVEPDLGEGFLAVEGNSNTDGSRDGYAVVRHTRSLNSVNRFIRIPALRQAQDKEAGA